jgi:hypothetical protein
MEAKAVVTWMILFRNGLVSQMLCGEVKNVAKPD